MKRFRGFLHNLDIRELLQICTVNKVTGKVSVEGKGKGEIYLDRGEIVHATCGELQGVEGLQEIIQWGEGKVKLEPGVPSPAVTINLPWEALLTNSLAEEPPPEGEGKPSEAPKEPIHLALFSEAMRWREVEEWVLIDGQGEVLRPPVLPERTRQRAKALANLYHRSIDLVSSGDTRPLFISVTIAAGHWMIIPVGAHFLLLRVPKELNPKELLAKVNRAIGEFEGGRT